MLLSRLGQPVVRWVLPLGATWVLAGCGSRTRLWPGDEEQYIREIGGCVETADCTTDDRCVVPTCVDNACVFDPIVCEATEACHVAYCDAVTGECETAPATVDLDGDGFAGPLPGFAPGAPGACGEDCDDTRAEAYPGGVERCDGVDNDCDGIVDNGSRYLDGVVAEQGVVALAEGELDASASRGLAYGDGVFAAGYWGREEEMFSYVRGLDGEGNPSFDQQLVSNVRAPSFGVDLAWSGSSFGAVWSDARFDDNYEVFFARFDSSGMKLAADVRITDAPDFSIHSRVLYDQGRFALVFDDRRDGVVGARVYGQLVSAAGEVVSPQVPLSALGEEAEYPQLAATTGRFGLVYTVLLGSEVGLHFRSFDKNFEDARDSVLVAGSQVRAPQITALGSSFLVTWDVYGTGPGNTILGVLIDEFGAVLGPAVALTSGASYARSHDTLSLGDRALLLWADDFDGNYEVYAKVLSSSLEDVEPRTRLTNDPADTLSPHAALGDDGHIGIVFDDWRAGAHGAYFATLACSL